MTLDISSLKPNDAVVLCNSKEVRILLSVLQDAGYLWEDGSKPLAIDDFWIEVIFIHSGKRMTGRFAFSKKDYPDVNVVRFNDLAHYEPIAQETDNLPALNLKLLKTGTAIEVSNIEETCALLGFLQNHGYHWCDGDLPLCPRNLHGDDVSDIKVINIEKRKHISYWDNPAPYYEQGRNIIRFSELIKEDS